MKRIFLVFFVLILGLSMTSMAFAGDKHGGTLVMHGSNTPRHFNAAVQSGVATMVPAAQIFAAPLRFDENFKPHPYLAKSWKVAPDGLSVILRLVENATFHDGKPITSEDVAFSIKTIKENHPFKTMFAPVMMVDTPDPHTAIIQLAEPHPAILLALSGALCPIIPKHIYGDGQNLKTHPMNLKPVGSGPFKFVDYKPGEYYILERNENFFIKDRPYLDRIVSKVVKDKNNRLIAMERGETQFMSWNNDPHDIRRLKKNKNLVVTPRGYAGVGPICWYAFNTKKKPFDDKRVRQAIAYAVDRDFFTKRLHLGLSTPATGPIVPGSPYYSGNVEKYDLDLKKAEQLLDAAGYPKKSGDMRFSMSVDYIPHVVYLKQAAEYLKPQLKKIGIDVKVHATPDFPTWAKRISNWEFDVTADAVFNWGDPVIGVARTYLCNNNKKGVIWSNTQNYCNPEVDKLLNLAKKEVNMEKRVALYADFQNMVSKDVPVYWNFVIPYHTIYSKNLRDVPITIWGGASPWDKMYFAK